MARHVADRAGEIVARAYRLFAAHGFHGTGMADIAKSLGLGHGTVYRYFDGKLDLFSRVVDRVVETLLGALAQESPASSRTLDEYRDQVQRIGLRLADVFLSDPALTRLLFIESVSVDAAIQARVHQAMGVFAGYTAQYLRNGIDRGFLASDLDVDITARIMNSMVLEAVRHVVDADDPPSARDAWISAATRMIFSGIGTREARDGPG